MDSIPPLGTVVRLKSGGPPMTTGKPHRKVDRQKGEVVTLDSVVWCYWFDGAEKKEDKFNVALLEVVEDQSSSTSSTT